MHLSVSLIFTAVVFGSIIFTQIKSVKIKYLINSCTDRCNYRRVVIERAPKCERLTRRGIDRPLLVYKYGTEDAPRGEEIADTSVLRDGGETYLSQIPIFQRFFQDLDSRQSDFQPIDK